MAVINLRTRARLSRRPVDSAHRHNRARPRHLLLTTAVAGVIAAAGSLVGCGTAAAPGAGSGGSGGSHAPAAKATLSISLVSHSPNKTTHWTLRCDPVGGTAPDPAGLCRTLFGAKDTIISMRRHIMCPMILVSGRQIIVDGTWFGKKVHRVIIDGGCDVAIFNNLTKSMGHQAKIFN